MPSFDARTVVLVAFLATVLFFIILFALQRSLARPLPGLQQGVWAALSWSTGTGLIIARGAIPDFLSILVGNLAISGGILLMYSSLHISILGPMKQTAWLMTAAILGSISLINLFFFGNYSEILLFLTAYNATFYFTCSMVLWRARRKSFAIRLTAVALSIATIVSGTRFLNHAIGNLTMTQAFDPSIFQRVYFSLMGFSVLGALLGFILITYERLNKMLVEANVGLESEVAARTTDLRLEIEHKKTLERLVASTAEMERRRIGNELHDDLGQRLTGISLVAEVLVRELAKTSQSLSAHADKIQRAASDAIIQVRGLAHGLIPVSPEPEGFSQALAMLADTSSAPGVLCRFEYEEPVDIKNQDVATNLFRIAQEALSNALRHAQASVVTLRLDVIDGKVAFSIADNGCGFDWPRLELVTGGGRGMGIMEFRASLIHYQLDIESAPGRGTVIKVMEC